MCAISAPQICQEPVPVAARSKTWVCGRSLAGDNGFESRRWHGCLSLVVVCCQVELTAKGRSFVQGESYRVWCVSGCDKVH